MANENNETFPKKHLKRLTQEFIDATDQMNTDEVKARIITAEGNLFDIAGAKEADEKLQQAKEMVKEMAAPYSDAMKEANARIAYCVFALQSRGVNL